MFPQYGFEQLRIPEHAFGADDAFGIRALPCNLSVMNSAIN
jgi:hypothetical protein